jgi:hypothetical protein
VSKLAQTWPQFRQAIASLDYELSEEVPIAAIAEDGSTALNPRAVEELDVRELAAVLAHELMHLRARHFERARFLPLTTEDAVHLWRIAADIEINQEVSAAFYEVGRLGGLLPVQFGLPNGLPAEEYFRLLCGMARVDPAGTADIKAGGSAGAGGAGAGSGGGANDSAGAGDNASSGGANGKRKRAGRSRRGSEDCTESPAERLERAGFPRPRIGGGNVDGAGPYAGRPGRPLAAVAKFRAAVDALTGNGSAGGPGSEVFELSPQPEPAVELLEAIRKFLPRGYGAVRRTYLRPARRYIHTGCLRPSWTAEAGGKVVVVLDTSASMTTHSERIKRAVNILFALAAEVESIELIECDSVVRRHEQWAGALPRVYGGGGTHMAAAFEYINKHNINPDVVVVLTDGDSANWPFYRPDYPVVAALLWRRGQAPAWAHVVQLDRD